MKNLLIFEDFKEVIILEKNIPTNPELWSRCKAAAKAKYDVWPSAYAVDLQQRNIKQMVVSGKKRKRKSPKST